MEADEFLRRVQRRDAHLWQDVYPLVRKLTLGACRNLGIFDSSREDIVQDVAIKVFTQSESFQGDSKLSTWIYSIARNRCIDDLRKSKATVSISEGDHEEPLTAIDKACGRSDMLQRLCVQQMLAEMELERASGNSGVRRIDLLRWIVLNSPTTDELAVFFRTSAAAAKERKSQLLKYVRELCERFCGHGNCSLSEGA